MRYKKKETCDETWIEWCVDKTLDEIAEHFNVAKTTARARTALLGIKIKRTKKYQGIIEYAKDHTIKECAEHYNSNYYNISNYLRKYKIQYKRELTSKGIERVVIKRTGTVHDMILTLCETYSISSVAKVFGYSKERVRQIYHENKGE